ncbi:hypothetical protein [Streptomyces sp. NPDC093109]|uniref:hypothetical protein n=1 Tax=Streptomyces sp. NPDC093109 TaxID=3154977 RepID=UPI00344B4E59
MSALTLRGPDWVTGRLHRRALWTALVLLVLMAGVTAYLWWRTAAAYNDFTATGCVLPHEAPPADGCELPTERYEAVEDWFFWLLKNLQLLLPVLPAVIGSFVAGPVIARELQDGSYRLAWTQSVSPARWLLSRLALPTAWAVLLTAVFTVVFRLAWSHGPLHTHDIDYYDDFFYLGLGPVLVGYVVFGIGVGTLAAVLTRETVTAISVTSTAVVIVGFAFAVKLRGMLLPTTTTAPDEPRPDNSWVVDWRRVPMPEKPDHVYEPGMTAMQVDYYPASHFWPLQFIETGILLALAALAVYGAFRALRRLHA